MTAPDDYPARRDAMAFAIELRKDADYKTFFIRQDAEHIYDFLMDRPNRTDSGRR